MLPVIFPNSRVGRFSHALQYPCTIVRQVLQLPPQHLPVQHLQQQQPEQLQVRQQELRSVRRPVSFFQRTFSTQFRAMKQQLPHASFNFGQQCNNPDTVLQSLLSFSIRRSAC